MPFIMLKIGASLIAFSKSEKKANRNQNKTQFVHYEKQNKTKKIK
jgi:hypothetical protein